MKSTDFNCKHPLSIKLISVNKDALPFDKSTFSKKLLPENIWFIFVTKDKSKWEVSIEIIFSILSS